VTRTEADVRNAFPEPAGIDDAAARLIASFTDPEALDYPTRAVAAGRSPGARWATAAAGAAAVAAIATTVLIAPGLGHHTTPTGDNAATNPSGSATRGHAAVTGSRPHQVDVTPQVAVRTLISLLPRAGRTTKLTGQSALGEVGGTVVYDDGHGAAQLAVSVDFPYTYRGTVQRQAAGSLCPGVTDGDPCTTMPDGSQVTTYQGTGNVPGGPKDWEVRVLRPDGVEVDVTEWNAPLEKIGQQTRPEPPFTIAELIAIARSPKWQATITAAQARSASTLFTPEHS
jgi:hypothetical protein